MVVTQPCPNINIASDNLMTAEELFMLPDDAPRELVNGKVIETMPPGLQHGEMAGNIYATLKVFVSKHNLGRCFVESGFLLRRDPDLLRSPDVSFVEKSRLPEGRVPRGFFEGAPTLAVEIISPHDLWSDVEDKVQEYLETGARAVWVFDPGTQTAQVRAATFNTVYHRFDTLTGGDILPGFELPLSEIFED